MNTIASDNAAWPRDTKDYVFLARAIEQLGSAIFPDAWSGTEQQAIPLPRLPAFANNGFPGNRNDRANAHANLLDHPGYVPKPSYVHLPPSLNSKLSEQRVEDYSFSAEMWAVATRKRDEKIAALSEPLKRLRSVRARFVDLATMGSVRTILRPKRGIDIALMSPDVWSIVRAWQVFDWCQINPREPAALAISGDAFQWVFVFKEDLAAVFNAYQSQPENEDGMEPAHINRIGPDRESNKGIGDSSSPEGVAPQSNEKQRTTKINRISDFLKGKYGTRPDCKVEALIGIIKSDLKIDCSKRTVETVIKDLWS